MSTAPTLFDLDRPIRRRTWSTVPCNVCRKPLRRYVRQDPATGWYRYSLDATAWDHMRAHHAGRSLITPWPFGLRYVVTERQPG